MEATTRLARARPLHQQPASFSSTIGRTGGRNGRSRVARNGSATIASSRCFADQDASTTRSPAASTSFPALERHAQQPAAGLAARPRFVPRHPAFRRPGQALDALGASRRCRTSISTMPAWSAFPPAIGSRPASPARRWPRPIWAEQQGNFAKASAIHKRVAEAALAKLRELNPEARSNCRERRVV